MTTKEASFSSLKISSELLQVVEELGYKTLTPVQEKSIPVLLEGKDLIGQSKTGSGKTAAFSIPILEKIDLRDRKVQALILCPTRELCTQVAREIRKLGRRHMGLQVLILAGGQPIRPQLSALYKGAHIVVGTPGRILDHLRRNPVNLKDISTLVLDEADRMLDMGFEEEMTEILDAIPKDRQTVLFSATYPESIEEMSESYQTNPVRVTIEDEDKLKTKIEQIIYEVEAEDKFNAVLWALNEYKPESAIIFCNLKITVKELNRNLIDAGVSAACLHGDLEQPDRDKVMAKFRNGSVRILIATDVAARGIDIADLDLVCNYDLPNQSEIYTHRIGRTGRAGKSGLAISFATPDEDFKLENLERKTIGDLNVEAVENNDAGMETLFISGGRKDKMRPGDILGALTGDGAGLKGDQVGKIEIHDRFSYVAVSKEVSRLALTRLRNGRIKGKKFRIELVR